MARTPKFDAEVRGQVANAVKSFMDGNDMFAGYALTAEGLTFAVGTDPNGVARYATLKVVVHGDEFNFDEAVADKQRKIREGLERAQKAEQAKADKAAKAAAKAAEKAEG